MKRIVLSGGPCAGKSTAMSYISDRLRSLGQKVFIVPEAATLMIMGGLDFANLKPNDYFFAQQRIMEMQLALEDNFLALSDLYDEPKVILYDRGIMDVSAFMNPADWQALLDDCGWNLSSRDSRYDAVIHMVSAAVGAEAFYTTQNNPARRETVEQAAAVERMTQAVWLGHPHLRVIDNSTDFETKIKRTVAAVCGAVGIPRPIENERKFLLLREPDQIPVPHVRIEIEQLYLTDGARIRRRGQNGNYTYFHTVKKPIGPGKNIETEHQISGRDFGLLRKTMDQKTVPVLKHRTCFLWDHQYLELDSFTSPAAGMVMLEIEIDEDDQKISIPPFLSVDREVTADQAYTNRYISLYAAR